MGGMVLSFPPGDFQAGTSGASLDARPLTRAFLQNFFHALQIFFRIHPNAVVGCFGHMNRNAILQKAQLFKAFTVLQRRFGQVDEAVQSPLAVRVESEMLEVPWMASI